MHAVRVQAGSGPHAALAREVVLIVILAELVGGAAHDGPPHAHRRAPRHVRAKRAWRPARGSLSGRRARG